MESSTPQRRSCFILIIKRLNHSPFQRAIPPACLRHPRAARSPHLPKCPTAEHCQRRHTPAFSKAVAVFCPPTTQCSLFIPNRVTW